MKVDEGRGTFCQLQPNSIHPRLLPLLTSIFSCSLFTVSVYHVTTWAEGWIQPPERKVWHPIVWQQPPPPIPPDVAPHQQLIRNIRRLLTETAKKPEERQKHIEHMMLALPTGPRPKNDDDCWGDDDPEPEPAPKPKKKKSKKVKRKVVARKRTESETSEEDSVTLDSMSTPAAAAEPIPEED